MRGSITPLARSFAVRRRGFARFGFEVLTKIIYGRISAFFGDLRYAVRCRREKIFRFADAERFYILCGRSSEAGVEQPTKVRLGRETQPREIRARKTRRSKIYGKIINRWLYRSDCLYVASLAQKHRQNFVKRAETRELVFLADAV